MSPNQLPPDTLGMNGQRSEWAEEAVRKFQRETLCDDEDVLCDLLCNLMHWADRNNMDFDTELARARDHYTRETSV